MADENGFADELARQMRNEAERRGLDPSLVQEEDVQVDRERREHPHQMEGCGYRPASTVKSSHQ